MKKPINIIVFLFCILVVLTLSGCALLAIPAEIIGGTFRLLGQILQVVSRLPKPPPGVIPGVF